MSGIEVANGPHAGRIIGWPDPPQILRLPMEPYPADWLTDITRPDALVQPSLLRIARYRMARTVEGTLAYRYEAIER